VSLIRGRFKKAAANIVNQYTSSLPVDQRLSHYDIAGSIAHARMLSKQGIISAEDARAIVRGLKTIKQEIERGEFRFNPELEDIHMNIEARLIEMIGSAGSKLHTARSRNDQIALDLRLFARDAIQDAIERIRELQNSLVQKAEKNRTVILPGYTHLQRAQPVTLAHYFLAYFEMFERDIQRLLDCLKRTEVMPLGSGALAGVAYNIDRNYVARRLGFSKISRNSLDAVSDRDFVIEYEAAASLCMMHLSRLAEEIILWSSAEFGFIELDDSYATGSSIMPQKKNPDVAELARGKVGRVYGKLVGMFTTMKGLPLAYNRDLQEDKEGFFDVVDTLISTLVVFSGMVDTMRVKPDRMSEALDIGYLLATDVADYLVKKGETFRDAHAIVGKLVSWATERGKSFDNITISEYKQFSALFGNDIYQITCEKSVGSRINPGGTAPERVAEALKFAQRTLKEAKKLSKISE